MKDYSNRCGSCGVGIQHTEGRCRTCGGPFSPPRDQNGETPIEREVRLEEEMNADLVERHNVRGISPPDY